MTVQQGPPLNFNGKSRIVKEKNLIAREEAHRFPPPLPSFGPFSAPPLGMFLD